jgi:hypothetical protein
VFTGTVVNRSIIQSSIIVYTIMHFVYIRRSERAKGTVEAVDIAVPCTGVDIID